MERSIIQLTDIDVDGNCTRFNTLIEVTGQEVSELMYGAIKRAIEDCKIKLEGKWTTEDIVHSVIESLKNNFLVDACIIHPSLEVKYK